MFGGTVQMQVSTNGGQTFNPVTANGAAAVEITNRADLNTGSSRFYDTQMTQLDLSGGSLPPGMMVRQSPTLPSLGETTVRQDPIANNFHHRSFFDIFTEVSLDGGNTWSPSISAPTTLGLSPSNSVQPINLTCSTNITTTATSSNGATVFSRPRPAEDATRRRWSMPCRRAGACSRLARQQ